jgi:hypothetical protein
MKKDFQKELYLKRWSVEFKEKEFENDFHIFRINELR